MAANKDKDDFTWAEKDKIQWENYNKKLEEEALREEKLKKHWEWAGNKLPPISIEPQPLERQRLAQPMTDAQRAARAQWLADQNLLHNEPVVVPELQPRNVFRRIWRVPGDKWQSFLNTVIKDPFKARHTRILSIKFTQLVVASWFIWHNLKYTPSTWEAEKGWHKWGNKPTYLPGDIDWPNAPTKEHDDFYDKGFKARTSHLDLKTSFHSD